MSDTEIQDDELILEFLVESYENLDQLDRDLVALETDPGNTDLLSAIFRTIHTIKGTAGFLGFSKLESLTHAAESLLGKLRDGILEMNAERTSTLLQCIDAVRAMLASIDDGAGEGEGDSTELIAQLRALQTTPDSETDTASREPGAEPPAATAAPVEVTSAAKPKAVPVAETKATPEATQAGSGGHAAEGSLRVSVDLLDKLMNLVGELVLARNQVLQYTAGLPDAALQSTTQRLNLITTELQEGVMKTRMQPIEKVWNRFPRLVRDLSQACGKKVAIRMEGKQTEVDKTILESISDPLTHMVRNSIDHGLELPAERLDGGKPAEGLLQLRAFHEGGQVIIEIADDGRGIDPAMVKATALERQLITPDQAALMSDRDLVNLVFLPGFSTATTVTNVSGRGVGMDVVRTNIEKIGGTVDVLSTLGVGTTVTITIPLTLAIIPAVIVSSCKHRFAIPQGSLVELVRLEGERAESGIEMIHGAPVHRLRGRLLPLVSLERELGLEATVDADQEPMDSESDPAVLNIVVLEADNRQFGLVVDQISDTEEIVVKPLGRQLSDLDTFSGATIMGDGLVALILDVVGIAKRTAVLSDTPGDASTDETEAPAIGGSDKQSLLLFDLEGEQRMAVPLGMVARLEELDRKAIETAGDLSVIQYRGQLMPIIDLAQELGAAPKMDEAADDILQLVVYSDRGRVAGLVVQSIRDVVEESFSLQECTRKPGILGSAVVEGRITNLVDVTHIVERAVPQFFSGEEIDAKEATS